MNGRTFRWFVAGVVFAVTAAVAGALARRLLPCQEATDDVTVTTLAAEGAPDADTPHPAAV